MDFNFEGEPFNVIVQQECQSSYVEMSRDDTAKDCDYFCMEKKNCSLKQGNSITTRKALTMLYCQSSLVIDNHHCSFN